MNLKTTIIGLFAAIGALIALAASTTVGVPAIASALGVLPVWLAMGLLGTATGAAIGLLAASQIDGQRRALEVALREDDPGERSLSHLWKPLRCLAQTHDMTVTALNDQNSAIRSRIRQMEVQNHIAQAEVKHLQDVLHSLRDAVLVTNSFNELVLANDAAAGLLGFNRTEVLNKQVGEVVRAEQVVSLIREASQAGSTATRRNGEILLETDAQQRNIEVALSSLMDTQRDSAHVVTILHDITQEREVSKMKNEFVSKASHELRTPLSSIKAYIEMLIDGEASDEKSRGEFYEIIQHEAERLGRMIDDMLNISRIEAGMFSAEWESVDFVEVAKAGIALLTPQAEVKNITITLSTPLQGCIAEADADMIKQVITNLVSNAIKYTPEGGKITVAPDLTDCNRSVIVSVTDTGLGIPEDDLPKLFGKFFRVGAHERFAKGTGLGLNLVKQIVESVHHGEVGVESEDGKGSRFWFIVPCKQGD